MGFKDQTVDQSVSTTVTTGFNLADMIAEGAEPIPSYILKGMSKKVEVNLWDQFHKTIIAMVKKGQEDPEQAGMSSQFLAMALPMMIAKVTGKFDADVQPIWRGFTVEGKTPVDMVNALTERLAKMFELLRTEGNEGFGKEEN